MKDVYYPDAKSAQINGSFSDAAAAVCVHEPQIRLVRM
jgi:hypothetical protein